MSNRKTHKLKANRKKQNFFDRAFLNDIDSEHTGSIRGHLEVSRYKDKKKGRNVWELYGGLEVRDCSRRIDLAFDGDTEKYISQIENGIKKYNSIINVCERQKHVLEQILSLAEKEKKKVDNS